MAINADEDTEFNDALRQHGILPPKPEEPKTPSPPPSPTLEDMLEDFEPKELVELAEDARDDDEARVIEAYRRQRMAEMRLEQRRARFGRVYPIGRDDYTREVTEASKVDEEGEEMKGKGTGVVCFLYKDSHVPSERAFGHIRTLAERHPRTKFVSIVGDKCIPNYPDKNLPTLFVYVNGNIINQQVSWGADRERSLEELEALLVLAGAIVPADYIRANRPGRSGDDEATDDISDDEAFERAAMAKTNGSGPKNIRGPTQQADDDDSDFDM